MTSVCRYDEAFRRALRRLLHLRRQAQERLRQGLATPRVRVWALAVERELVRGDGSEALGGPAKQGVVIGVRDKIDEVDEVDKDGKPTGNKLKYPAPGRSTSP
jgi:hypothetical protein